MYLDEGCGKCLLAGVLSSWFLGTGLKSNNRKIRLITALLVRAHFGADVMIFHV